MARKEITEKTVWDDAFGQVAYTADALALAGEDGDEDVGALAARLERVLEAWVALDNERRDRRRAVGRANALVRQRDLQADNVVTVIHDDVLRHVEHDKTSQLFRRLFPDPLATVVRMALASELPVLRLLLARLEETATPPALREQHSPTLTVSIEMGEQAVRWREDQFALAGRTGARSASWRDDANNVLIGTEAALQQISSERKLSPEWLETFFPRIERKKQSESPPQSDEE